MSVAQRVAIQSLQSARRQIETAEGFLTRRLYDGAVVSLSLAEMVNASGLSAVEVIARLPTDKRGQYEAQLTHPLPPETHGT